MQLQIPNRVKGQKNKRPSISPTYGKSFIEIAARVTVLDSPEMIKAAKYLHNLGVYLGSEDYRTVVDKRIARKEKSLSTKKDTTE